MDVGAIASNRATNASSSSSQNTVANESSSASLDYNAFLKLLIAQMQNQDPLEPLKSSDYVAQLATFSQVEKSVEMNARLTEVLSAVQMQQAGALIGQKVTSADGVVTGIVDTARIVDGGVVAVFEDGREIAVGPDVIVGGRST